LVRARRGSDDQQAGTGAAIPRTVEAACFAVGQTRKNDDLLYS
jgi:hypothetical protein